MNKGKIPSRLPAMREVFKQVWLLFKERWGVYLVSMGLYYLFSLIPLAILVYLIVSRTGILSVAGQDVPDFNFLSLGSILTFMIIFGALIFISLWFGAIKYLVVLSKEKHKVRRYLSLGLKKLWPLLVTQLASGWFFAGLVSLAIIIPVFLAIWLDSFLMGLLAIPTLVFVWWYGLHFVFVGQIAVKEEIKGWAAMRRSFAMVEKRVGSLFGRLLILAVFQLVLAMVGSDLANSEQGTSFLVVILGMVMGILARMLPLFYLAIIYAHFKKGVFGETKSCLVNKKVFLAVSAGWFFVVIVLIILAGHWLSKGGGIEKMIEEFDRELTPVMESEPGSEPDLFPVALENEV